MTGNLNLNKTQLFAMVLLRVLTGWHFLYEGLVKLTTPEWSSAGYLLESKWVLAGVFRHIARDPEMLRVVDFLNIWGLILIGLGLILGLLTRISGFSGMLLILLYYAANPPLPGLHYTLPMEGEYLIVNKTLIEFAGLMVITFLPTGKFIGLDRFLLKFAKLKNI